MEILSGLSDPWPDAARECPAVALEMPSQTRSRDPGFCWEKVDRRGEVEKKPSDLKYQVASWGWALEKNSLLFGLLSKMKLSVH